ncbi:endolytic transglycosylase MltG [Schaalia suimastitidis]|uniref:endolytic transglycosylase MltG n=1 Tax=Schaalia suimastitidis TaxID=121163 RepID=UPI00041FED9D|nr:endolytic transglycosylase MltG [Schaalia suimastitidis]
MTDEHSTPRRPLPRRSDIHGRPRRNNEAVAPSQPALPSAAHTPATPVSGSAAPTCPASLPSRRAVTAETTGMRSRRLEHERRRAKARRRNRRIRSVLVLLVVLGLIGTAVWYAMTILNEVEIVVEADDYPGPGTGAVEVVVEEGETGTDIGNKLVQADVVKSVSAFVRAWEANKASSTIRPGTYSLKLQMSAAEALAALLDEANRSDNTVTVNPGETVKQITERMASVTGFSTEEITAAFADASAIGLPQEAAGNPEGWLLPGSYEVSTTDTPTSLISKMVTGMVTQLQSLGVDQAQWHTVLTKASIVEREVNVDQYLPMVARVIENRLADTAGETRGLLQMDSTVLYGVGKSGGVPTAEDLRNDNPYNTYIKAGLPPTPIAQPSIETIQAVLAPADGTWLYFVTVNLDTGETLFATTLAEQEQNKLRFDQYCAENPGKC